jgi:protein Mpv17
MFVFLTPSLVAVGFFFGTMSILEGKGISGARDRISTVSMFPPQAESCSHVSQAYTPTLIRNW